MRSKRFIIAALFLLLLFIAIPFEHKYDKLFRYFSLTLIPKGLSIPDGYDKKIYFYASDVIALILMPLAIFWYRIPLRQFFFGKSAGFLWAVFFLALISITVSPFVHYPIPYIRLLQLATPILIYSFIAQVFSQEEKQRIAMLIFAALFFVGIFESGVAIAQYFKQGSIGLRLLGEQAYSLIDSPNITIINGSRWIFDRIFHRVSDPTVLRATGTLPHPNVLGGFLTLSILSSYPLLLKLSNKFKFWIALFIPFLFFALFITYCRSALLAWFLSTIAWYSMMIWKEGLKNLISNKSIRFLTALIFISVSLPFILLYEQIHERGGIINSSNLSKASDSTRISYHQLGMKIIQDYPLTGTGYTQFTGQAIKLYPNLAPPELHPTGPHNIYLYLAVETGLISLAAFLIFIGARLRAAIRSPSTPVSAILLSIFIAFLLIGLVDFYPILFQQGKLMFFGIAGLLAAQESSLLQLKESYG